MRGHHSKDPVASMAVRHAGWQLLGGIVQKCHFSTFWILDPWTNFVDQNTIFYWHSNIPDVGTRPLSWGKHGIAFQNVIQEFLEMDMLKRNLCQGKYFNANFLADF